MKPNIKILAILFTAIVLSILSPKPASAQQASVSFQVFYDQLSPYGQWVDYPNYGFVWIPDAGSDFVPYSSGGHWILTDYGWTWASDYSWGWAPFHYGRWSYDRSYGWFWLPDNVWGPSWVTWRHADGYYGWSPMGPGMSLTVSFGSAYNSHNQHWTFVRDRDFERKDINRYYINHTDRDRIVRNSKVINKTYVDNSRHTTYVSGPAREDLQKVTGRKVNIVAIQENSKPGQNINNGQLRIYRPQVSKSSEKGIKTAPARITNLKEVRPPSERKATNQSQDVNKKAVKNAPPAQSRTLIQQDNNKKEQPRKAIMPAKPTNTQNSKPTNNSKREEQPNTIKPSNNNKKVQPSQPPNANIHSNSKNEQPPKASMPVKTDRQAQAISPLKSNPSENNRQEHQPKAVNQPNNNNKAQPSQPRNAIPANNRQEQHQNAAKPENNTRRQQPKESKPEQDKRR